MSWWMNGKRESASGNRNAWGITENDRDAARRDLESVGIIDRRAGGGFNWGEAADATSRAILSLAAGTGWSVRAVVNGQAHLLSKDGRRELKLVVEFEPLRVVHAITHDGRDLSPVDALDFLAGES